MVFFKEIKAVGTFKLEKYNDTIYHYENYFPLEKKSEALGFIDSAKTAKNKAEMVWIEIYGKSIKRQKPYQVFFDETNEVWLITGSFPMPERLFKSFKGGVAHILIQKSDGKVLAIWHDK